MSKPFSWKIFWILLAACTFGTIAILPYTLALQSNLLAQIKVSLPILIFAQVLQSVVLFAVAILIGLAAANRIGLGLPILEAKLNGEPISGKIKAMILPSIIIGVVASAAVVAIDAYGFGPALMAELGDKAKALNLQTGQPAAWKGLLASFYGGIDEEVLLRLCVMSVLAWLGKFVSKTSDGKPTTAVFWVANILAAVLFGLGHLPATATLVPITPLVVTRAIVLNGLVGVCTGYLYTKYGLESAMLSHFSADIVLHVLLAL